MAYDEELAERIRELVAGEPNLTEKKMFGGLAFLIGGNMAIAASGQEERWFVSIRTSRISWLRRRTPSSW